MLGEQWAGAGTSLLSKAQQDTVSGTRAARRGSGKAHDLQHVKSWTKVTWVAREVRRIYRTQRSSVHVCPQILELPLTKGIKLREKKDIKILQESSEPILILLIMILKALNALVKLLLTHIGQQDLISGDY